MSDNFTWTHLLYRLFDAEENLLYIGRTNDLKNRFAHHARAQPWWSDVARSVVQTLPDFAALCAAEKTAIIDEKPRHNVVHNGRVFDVELEDDLVPAWLSISARVAAAADDLHDDCRDDRAAQYPEVGRLDTAPCGHCAVTAIRVLRAADTATGGHDHELDLVETAVIHERWEADASYAAAHPEVARPRPCMCDDCSPQQADERMTP